MKISRGLHLSPSAPFVRIPALFCGIFLVAGGQGTVKGASVTLTAADATGTSSFNTAGHWSSAAAPSAGNTYTDTGFVLRTPSAGGNVTFAGDRLTIAGGGSLVFKGTNNDTVTINDLQFDGGSMTNGNASSGVNWKLAGTITLLSGGGVLDAVTNSSVTTTVNAGITGTGVLTIKSSTAAGGKVLLTGSNTYSGGTIISNGGVLVLGATNTVGTTGGLTLGESTGNTTGTLAMGTGTTAFNQTVSSLNTAGTGGASNAVVGGGSGNSSTLTANTSTANVFAGKIGGSGTNQNVVALTLAGTGSLTLSGTNTYTGVTTVSGGLLDFSTIGSLYNSSTGSLSSANAAKVSVASGATLALGVGGTGYVNATDIGTVLVNTSLASGAILGFDTTNAGSGTFSYGSAIANTGGGTKVLGVTKLGTNTLVLSGASSYTGGTKIASGTLQLGATVSGSNSALGNTGNTLTVSGGGALDLNGFNTTVGALTLGNGSAGSTLANSSTAATLTTTGVTVSGTNNTLNSGVTVSGAVNLSGAALTNNGALSGNVTVGDGTLSGAGTVGGTVGVTSGTINGNGLSLSGLATFTGNGTLSGTETATAGISVAAGASVAQSGTLTGNVNLDNGAASLSSSGTSSVGAITLNGGGNTVSSSGTLTTGGLKVNGTNNTIGNGEGTVGGGATIGANASLTVNGTLTGTTTVTGTAGGNAGLNGNGATGNVTVGGSGGGTGTVGGTLTTGVLTVAANGIVSPGNSPGTLGASSAIFQSGGQYTLQMNTDGGSGSAGANWDKLALTGSLDLSGLSAGMGQTFVLNLQTLNGSGAIGLLGSFDPGANHTWTDFITTGGVITGFDASFFSFLTTDFQENNFTGNFSVALDGHNLDLVYTATVPEPRTWALMLGGLAMLVFWQSRNKRHLD